jgi:Flp pilus assembly pilin Flp
MQRFNLKKQLGQGMTEYIIIVALIAIGAIGVYTAFGDVIRGQTSVAASTLAGANSGQARQLVTSGQQASNNRAVTKGLNDFESATTGGTGN